MSEPIEIRLEESLKAAWALFAKSPEVFITIAFAFMGGSMVLGNIPFVGSFTSLLLGALGPAAFFLAADEAHRTGKATFQSLNALTQLFPQLLALFVVKTILVGVGFVLLILPGIYIAVLLVFSELFVVVEGKTFVDALKASRNMVQGNWLAVFGFCLVLAMIAFSGVLLIGLGLLLTMPFAALTLYCVFRRSHPRSVTG